MFSPIFFFFFQHILCAGLILAAVKRLLLSEKNISIVSFFFFLGSEKKKNPVIVMKKQKPKPKPKKKNTTYTLPAMASSTVPSLPASRVTGARGSPAEQCLSTTTRSDQMHPSKSSQVSAPVKKTIESLPRKCLN